jgi:RNA polymerase-binding transcription factor DksA
MDNLVNKQIGVKLLKEIDRVMHCQYRHSFESMKNKLHLIESSSNDPASSLASIQKSGILYISSDPYLVRIREAVRRFIDGTYGTCIDCGQSIPVEWLLRSPLLEYCYECSILLQPMSFDKKSQYSTQ